MSITKSVRTRYIDDEQGFTYTFEPIEDSLSVKKVKSGFEVRYLVYDSDPMPPDEYGDDNIFLVHYHRDFWIEHKSIITEADLRSWYKKDFEDYASECDDNDNLIIPDHLPQEDAYRIFAVSAYIHSGVRLSLLPGNWNPFDSQGWDTSHVGAVLVSKKEWPDAEKAYQAAESLIETWNQYLSGDVYGIVKETYDKKKEQIDQESVWGFYGYKDALEALKTEI